MKKFILMCAAAALVLMAGACSSKEKDEQLKQAQAMAEASREELTGAIADRDQLIELVNQISTDMNQIKALENIVTVTNGIKGESKAQRTQIQADIEAIKKTLTERRQRLEQLEKKLSQSSLSNTKLQETITALRSQIDSQAQEIESLRGKLDNANREITTLGTQVDSLTTTVTTVTDERNQAQEQALQATNELNTCYYVIGTKSELKAHDIIESGFLRKTKIMPSDFDQDFFTTADKRTLTQLNLNSSKAEVMTNQPKDSYTIETVGKQKVLTITDPTRFWSVSNYLVVKID